MTTIDAPHLRSFNNDGFVIVENFLPQDQIEALRSRFPLVFNGQFETGIQPDEWNWRPGRDSEELTRQICNGWKSDRILAATILARDVGKACATLAGWPGARINQDNILWKPPGTKSLGFHQDVSYQHWISPSEMLTCWITLDDTKANQGTIEYVKGSHLWPLSPPISRFHAPDDPLEDMLVAAKKAGFPDPEITPIVVPAGSAVFHHGRTWHGSRANHGENPRRAVVSHCMSSAAKFSGTATSAIYSRYKRHGDNEMDESFFPILWRNDGYRTPWLDDYIAC